MKCPLCDETNVEHIVYKGTHIYVCEDCPFVGFELILEKDYKNMIDWLKGKR